MACVKRLGHQLNWKELETYGLRLSKQDYFNVPLSRTLAFVA